MYAQVALHNQYLGDEDVDILVKQSIINKQCKELWLQLIKSHLLMQQSSLKI